MEPNSPPNSIHCNSHQNQESQYFNHENDDESLSLCDLPTTNHEDPFSEKLEEDFDFSGFHSNNLPKNKMSSADELFFRGQILPLQHSISFSGSDPESVDSSRSSSTRSSTSGSEFTGYKLATRIRNQFHSHPSPTPQIRTRSVSYSDPKTSSRWRFLHLGVMKPQEIGLEDLKNRSQRSNSKKDQNQNNSNNNYNRKNKKMEMLLFGGCKCSANVIEDTVCSRIPMVKQTCLKEEETNLRISKESNVGRRKHADAVSSHRTSEWLKQLSIQDNALLYI